MTFATPLSNSEESVLLLCNSSRRPTNTCGILRSLSCLEYSSRYRYWKEKTEWELSEMLRYAVYSNE